METHQEQDTSAHKQIFGLQPVVFFTGLVSLLTDLSSEMIVPILPLFLTSVLHAPAEVIGFIEGVAESTASIVKWLSGWLSDRLGRRKPLMVAGYSFSNIIKPLFALTTAWGQVLAIRFADRFGKGIRGAPRDALIADATTERDRGKAFGFHRALDTLGAALGPFVAFWILRHWHGDFRKVFWAAAIPGILSVILLVGFVQDATRARNAGTHASTRPPKITFHGAGKRFAAFTAVAALFAVGNSSDAFLILRAQNVGMAAVLVPLAYFVFNVVYALAAIPLGVLSDRIGRRKVLVAGYLVFAIIYSGFADVHRAVWVWLLFLVYGLYYAATEGVQKAYVADLVDKGQRGTAMGTFNAVTGLAALPASIMAGVLWQTVGPWATFTAGAICAALAATLMAVFRI